MTELIKCECGEKRPIPMQHNQTNKWAIWCMECNKLLGYFNTEAEAKEAWNRRGEE